MLRHHGLGELEFTLELPNGAFPAKECSKDRQPRGVAEESEEVVHGAIYATIDIYLSRHISEDRLTAHPDGLRLSA